MTPGSAVLHYLVAPGGAALATALVCGRLGGERVRSVVGAALPVVVGFCAGCWLLHELPMFAPKRHWHWIPLLSVLTIAPAAMAARLCDTTKPPLARRSVYLLVALAVAFAAACAWRLTPTWKSLAATRWIWIGALTVYFSLLGARIESLCQRLGTARMLNQMSLAMLCTVATIGTMVSVVYGAHACLAAAAVSGVWLAASSGFVGRTPGGAGFVYALLAGGWAFVGCIEPRQPLFAVMLMPLAPLAMELRASGPLSRVRGGAGVLVETGVVVAVLAVAAVMALMRVQ